MKKITTTFALLLAFLVNNAQTAPAWAKYVNYYNVQNYDVINVSTGVDTLGNIYTAASIYDSTAVNNKEKIMLVKYDTFGVQQWIKYYVNTSNTSNICYAAKLLVDKAGNCYVCGYGSHNATSSLDFMVAKYDNTGFQQWVSYYDGGQNIADYLTCAKFDAAGNVVVAGNTNFQGTNQYDIAVVKIGISGTQFWSYNYNNATSNFDENVYDLATDINNNVYITGNTYVTNARNMLTIKLNSSGVNQWTNIVPHSNSGTDEYGYGITADALGNCYATGALNDWATIKYNAGGAVVWTNHRPASTLNSFSPKHILLDKFNNAIIASDAFFGIGAGGTNLEVNKINGTNGATIWSTNYNFGGTDSYVSFQKDTADNVFVAGFFDGPLNKDISALVLSPNGVVVWQTSFTNTTLATGVDRACQLVLDKNKNIIIAGNAERRGSGSSNSVDVVTLKYNTLAVGIKINTLDEGQLSIFPNPTKGTLNLTTQNANLIGATILINDLVGNTVLEQRLTELNQSITLSGLAKGIYILKLSNTHSTISKKLIIE